MSDVVADDELLYRCVFYGSNCYHVDGQEVRVSGQAFADRSMAPSVDRANLCGSDPAWTQRGAKNAVVSLTAGDVRLTKTVFQSDSKGQPVSTYQIDVCSRPIAENPAHAQIEPSPEYKNKAPFRKLLERLAFLANQREWEILPYEMRVLKDKGADLPL